ncbi:MAG TPA: hypothetical protein PLE99_12225 [Candidatus Thiothrix moscowensis]|uniref:hypothetical protein n=1 Tax=unclassified Thiothrix TaxID=2636184 RepID=UPI001A30A188|nr:MULTISPECIES: hypothetical protein [unclassified Thiothrix]MBJ6610159.1 hypothetical protein [Candidatus Thiothrix moscowensis]HRJ53525.1 hypothetical protein [Candidatus Thiothrix moscowensis]HRJ93667.1 hypothetical protein [Candidatus Thiothrix moscowensis]
MRFKRLRFFSAAMMATVVLIGSVSVVNAAIAEEPRANVTLVATINNGPAMRPVRWTLYRLENNSPVWVDSFRRHSATIPLKPGRYRAEANLNNVNRSRVFDVSTRSNSSVVVAMD